MTVETCTHQNRTVARARGARVRRRCTNCLVMGPWEYDAEAAQKAHPNVQEKTSTPNPPIPTKVSIPEKTGKGRERLKQAQDEKAAERIRLNDLTVKQLKSLASDRNLSGYSALKKQELIDLIVVG